MGREASFEEIAKRVDIPVAKVHKVLKIAQQPIFFFFNDRATTEFYPLSLHDALPIWVAARMRMPAKDWVTLSILSVLGPPGLDTDRKSTCLNSSHANISYAVFCL